ncbi:MAG: hypothetical protein HQ512_06100 [Rhodospirillales bacterium]|nr:hypothetical protein [Rhodospirillales bacterium]
MAMFGWLASLTARLKKGGSERLSEKTFAPSGPGLERAPKIVLARLVHDKGAAVHQHLGKLLVEISGVEVFRRKETLTLPDGIADPVEQLFQAAEEGAAWLQEEAGDILVWGEIDKEGNRLTLRLLPAPGGDGDTPGVGETLEIPADFGDAFETLIKAAVIGVFGPTFKGARAGLGETLGGYLEQTALLIESPPPGLSDAQAVSIFNVIGNIFVAYSNMGGGPKQLSPAVKAYKEAEKRVAKDSQPLVWARIQNNLAAVLMVRGQKEKEAKHLRSAALIYSTIAAHLSPSAHTNDWAGAQTNLAKSLYVLAGAEAKPEYMERAVEAYEAVLGVYDQTRMPGRWAEVTNQYGVLLLAMGEEMGGREALERAVEKFRAAMKVHNRERAPLLWAKTANNLGAACFALAKRNSQNTLLREASDCFEGATAIYREQGIPKQAQVIEKNMHRVQRLLTTRGG